MKTYCIRLFALFLLAVFGPALSGSAQADSYDVTDAIYDEVGLRIDLYLQDEPAVIKLDPLPPETGQWYLLDYVKLKPDHTAAYRGYHQTWESGHALCGATAPPGGWHLFRVAERKGQAGAYDLVSAMPLPGAWYELNQVEYLPPELLTDLPPALEQLLARSTGYRELRWIRPCPSRSGCHRLVANH